MKTIENIAHVSLIAGTCVTFAEALTSVEEHKAQLATLVAEALAGKPKDGPEGRALAKSVTDLLVQEHNWKRQTASDFLIKHLGLRCRAERSDKGKGGKGEGDDDAALPEELASLRDEILALAAKAGDEKAIAAVLKAAYLSAKGKAASADVEEK